MKNMEDNNIEYKEKIPSDPENLKKEIVSFLNSGSPGEIFLGAKDNGEAIIFSSEEEKVKQYKEWEEILANWITDAFLPEVRGLIEVYPNSTPFKIIVRPGNEKPYYYTKKGTGLNTKGIYVRIGSTKRLASEEEIRRMIYSSERSSFETTDSGMNDLTFESYKSELLKQGKEFDENSLRIKHKDNKENYNQTGLILSDQNIYETKLAVYNGITLREFLDKRKYDGSIITQIKEILSVVDIHNKHTVKISGEASRKEVLSYPDYAVREAIINAFAHRDYQMRADIRIELFDDRLEIHSPGSIPGGMSVEDIKSGLNARRNDNLVNALDKINYMENYGSGIRRIYSSYSGFSRQPIIESSDSRYTIILFNKNFYLNQLEIDNPLNQVIEYLKDGELASRLDIEKELGLKKSATLDLLNRLVQLNLITIVGQGKNTKYSLKGK